MIYCPRSRRRYLSPCDRSTECVGTPQDSPGLACGSLGALSWAHEACSFTRGTLTPIWQLPVLPSVPEY